MNAEFWRDRKVLVTGHTGFKGSWLTLWLHAMGARVCGYSLAPATSPSLFEVARVPSICESHIGDIRDRARFEAVVEAFQPEVVLHLAAQALVRPSYVDPVETYSVNVVGLATVFDVVRRCETVRTVVNVTSDKCYENNEWVWGYRETDPMGGYDPYSSSKGCAELVTAAFRRSYFAEAGKALASGRAGNVIGGGDWALDRLVPDFVRAITEGRELVIRMPRATRPWQHVLEPLSGYLALAEAAATGEAAFASGFNFGPSEDSVKPVAWIAETICDVWGDGAAWRIAENSDLHEAQNLQLDSAKARKLLRWAPRWTIREALSQVVAWHKAHLGGADMQAVCLSQIEDYTNAL